MGKTLFPPKHSLSVEDNNIPECSLCGHEYEYEARYCIQCGASLADDGVAKTLPEWATTEELLDLSKLLSATLDPQILLKTIDDSAVRLTDADAGSIMLFDKDRSSLHFRSSSGEKAAAVRSLSVTDGIAWWVAAQGASARVDNVLEDARFTGAIDEITGYVTRAVLCVPVIMDDEIIGIIEVLNKVNEVGFSEQDEQLLSVLAGQAAVAVKNAKLATEQRNFFDHVIEILVTTVESTALIPEGHCWKVAKIANTIGRRMGMQDKELQDLYYAAALHDLGMLKLRKYMITEKEQIRSHPILGANMVRDIDMLRGAEFIIRHHHEYLDGSGYPDGLKGNEIPLGTRIIAVAEAYEEAVLETGSQLMAEANIHENAAKLFDTEVVDVFLELTFLG